jgi:hypothetical protein
VSRWAHGADVIERLIDGRHLLDLDELGVF